MREFNNYKEMEEKEEVKFIKQGIRYEIKSENNIFFLDPPIEHAKFYWFQEFHKVLGIVCSLPKLKVEKNS